MGKILKTSQLRALQQQVHKEEISYSKMVEIINQKAMEYAKECIVASLEKASENAEHGIYQNDNEYLSEGDIFINRESITNPQNIILL